MNKKIFFVVLMFVTSLVFIACENGVVNEPNDPITTPDKEVSDKSDGGNKPNTEEQTFVVVALPSSSYMGEVEIEGVGRVTDEKNERYNDSIITLTAKESENCSFYCWNDGKTDNPRTDTIGKIGANFVAIFFGKDAEGNVYADLGLPSGLKWATCNVGADSAYFPGSYFAWGDSIPNFAWGDSIPYDWENYKWRKEFFDRTDTIVMEKYNITAEDGDKIKVLTPNDDAAHEDMGGDWRMPTRSEQIELVNECTWEWVENYSFFVTEGSERKEIKTGKQGYKVIGKNYSHIFLPMAGRCVGKSVVDADTDAYYWSSSLCADDKKAACIYFGITVGSVTEVRWDKEFNRCYGFSVRGVFR